MTLAIKNREKAFFVFALLLILSLAPLSQAQSISAWQRNTFYPVGAEATYSGLTYECLQAHTSQVGWEPPNVPALWQPRSGTSPGFSISTSPASQSINAGASASYAVSIVALNGFSGTVSLSASGIPNGAVASFTPSSLNGSGTSTLRISTASSTPVGSYTVTVTGVSGSLSQSTSLTLTVNPSGGVPNWQANVAYAVGALVVYNGQEYRCLQAHTSLVGWEPPNVPALWQPVGAGGSPDFSLSISPSPLSVAAGAVVTATIASQALNGFNGTVTLSASGLPSGATATFSSSSIAASGSSTVTVSTSTSTPTGNYTLTFAGASGSLTHSVTETLTVTVAQKPGFAISAAPPSQTIGVGGSAAYNVSSSAVGGFSGTVSLSVSGLPSGATASFSPAGISGAGSSTLTVATSNSTPTGTSTLSVTGISGSLTASATVSLTVLTAPPPGLPKHLLLGYWQDFTNGSKCLTLSEVPTSFTIIAVAFANSTGTPGAVSYTTDSGLSSCLGGYTDAQFISDISTAHARGQKVIISVGGANGSISVTDAASASNFASSVHALMTQFGFDGVDIDLENGVNVTFLTSALKQLSSLAPGLIITMAPQTVDVASKTSDYFAVALNIQSILTMINTQYYNSGTMFGCDGNIYAEGTVDFETAQACILLQGGLLPSQVGLGLPASASAAGGGFVAPSVVVNALDCLTEGTNCGAFHPSTTWPTLRGAMTWDVNWDAANNYNFSTTVKAGLQALP